MATGGSSREELRKELTCAICLDYFTDPVILKCGHSFCLICICLHWDENGDNYRYQCPQCRTVTSLVASPDNRLRADSMCFYSVAQLLIDSDVFLYHGSPCIMDVCHAFCFATIAGFSTSTNKIRLANFAKTVWFCRANEHYVLSVSEFRMLGVKCFANEYNSNFMLSQVFNKKSYTKNYLVQSLIAKLDDLDCLDAGPQHSKALDVHGKCEKHGEELKFYCQTDKRPICVVCYESRAHRLVLSSFSLNVCILCFLYNIVFTLPLSLDMASCHLNVAEEIRLLNTF